MGLIDWAKSGLLISNQAVINLHFTETALYDVTPDEDEITETAYYDAMSSAAARGNRGVANNIPLGKRSD